LLLAFSAYSPCDRWSHFDVDFWYMLTSAAC
jgi:hypothetical protein